MDLSVRKSYNDFQQRASENIPMAMKESSDQPIDLSIRRQNAMVQPIDLEHDFPWKKSIVDVRERATLPPSKQEISI